jgi:hypothetical protein
MLELPTGCRAELFTGHRAVVIELGRNERDAFLNNPLDIFAKRSYIPLLSSYFISTPASFVDTRI